MDTKRNPITEQEIAISYTDEELKLIKNYTTIITGETKGAEWKRKASQTSLMVKKLIHRYGETGYGDKPPDMNRVEYWLQHINDE